MKFLVVGGGSMGKRRIRCLLANQIPAEAIRLVDTREDRRAEVRDKHQVSGLATLEDGLGWDPDVVIVSVPGVYHMEVCLPAARAGKHLFCEVPLALSLDGTQELTRIGAQRKLVIAPGCQVPFHPLFQQAKRWLGDPAFGKLLLFSHQYGLYLPDWHPYEDYRTFYASDQASGGGNLDVLAQDLAAIYWLIEDRIERLCAMGAQLSTLQIKGNDCWQLLARTGSGAAGAILLDMIQRRGQNSSHFVSEEGTIEIDLVAGRARRYLASAKQWQTVTPPADFVYEQCYIDEITLFLACIREDKPWHIPLVTAIDIVRVLLAVLDSSAQSRWQNV